MMVTADLLRALCPGLGAERAGMFALVMSAALPKGMIDGPRRLSHFLGQVLTETGSLRGLVESTAYKDPVRLDRLFLNVQGVDHAKRLIAAGPQAIANCIYANKLGNGGISSGDGWRFRGRGLMQLTGRANYRKIGTMIGMPLETEPELLGQPGPAAEAAALFWLHRGINMPADANDVATVTLLVNGPARLHMKERAVFQQQAAALLSN